MKKTYTTPTAEKIEFNYTQQVVASGCWYKNNSYWTHGDPTCNSNYHQGTSTQVPA